MSSSPQGTGLFIADYTIGTGLAGAVSCHLALSVDTVHASVEGLAQIGQAVNPPIDVRSKVSGNYVTITYIGGAKRLVTLTGYPVVAWPPHGGIGPVLLPNFHLQMVLDGDWKSGTATFSFQKDDGSWDSVKNVPVKINSQSGAASSDLAETAAPAQDPSASETRTVFLGDTLSVENAANVPSQGSVAMQYDSEYLALENAGISNKSGLQIQWTFKAARLGSTELNIITDGGIATFVMKRTIKVNVVLPDEASQRA